MNLDSPEMQAFYTRLNEDRRKQARRDMMETLAMVVIGAGLACWAYGTVSHTLLFAFVLFAVSVVGNRVVWEMRTQRAKDEARLLLDEQESS